MVLGRSRSHIYSIWKIGFRFRDFKRAQFNPTMSLKNGLGEDLERSDFLVGASGDHVRTLSCD